MFQLNSRVECVGIKRLRFLHWAACTSGAARRASEAQTYYPKDRGPALTRRLTVAEEKALFRRVRRGVPGAFQQAVHQYLRWALKLATSRHGKMALRGARLSADEAISAANAGLVYAIQHYDPAKKLRFTNYALWAIRKALCVALLDTYPVSVSYYFRKKLETQDVAAAASVFEQLFSGSSSDKAAQAMHERPEDAPYLPAEAVDPSIVPALFADDVRAFVAKLPKMEREALRARYYVEPAESYESIGLRLKASKNTVREAHDLALEKLRRHFSDSKPLAA